MLRILKYMKPFLGLLLLAVVLIFIQADADLTLPDYMSRIVNVGIQQGGIESPLPEAVRQSTMEHMLLFLSPEEKNLVLRDYHLLTPEQPAARSFVEKYPLLNQEPIYVLSDGISSTEKKRLERVLTKPLLIVFGIQRIQENPGEARRMLPGLGFDLSKLPPGTDLFALLAQMPSSQRAKIANSIDQRFQAIGGERAMRQAAAQAVKLEYEALGMHVSKIQNAYILRTGGLMLLIALISAIATVLIGYLGAKIAAGLARDLRYYLYEKVMRFSNAELDRFSISSLITRSTNDITQIQTALAIMVRLVFYAPIIGIGAILHALDKSPSMWWIITLALLVLLGIITTVFSIAVPKFKLIQRLIDKLNLIMRENLSGMMVVRAFNRQDYEQQRFDGVNVELMRTSLFVNRVFVVLMPVMMFVLNSLVVLILWVGSHQVAQSNIQVGDMIAFMQYAMQVVFAFLMLSMMFILFPRADVSANRIADVLETPISIVEPASARHFPEPFEPSIEFSHVYFRYPDADEDMLHDIVLNIQPGQTVGIMGTTGSGKSTLVNLIPRFYDVTQGALYIDGMDVREVSLKELRSKIGYVPQKSILFAGTIESNLRFGNEDADEETLRKALEVAQAAEFIFSKPEGLKARVAQGGANFSGGQRQRLTIARALVKKAPIYIFDECFSALDYKTDARLRRALREYLQGHTIIIVSQRVATIKDSDVIVVLDQGRVICQGQHQELLVTCSIYREIAESQLKQEALL